jgi:hypothetical protein
LLLVLTLFNALGATMLGWMGRTCMKKKQFISALFSLFSLLTDPKQTIRNQIFFFFFVFVFFCQIIKI